MAIRLNNALSGLFPLTKHFANAWLFVQFPSRPRTVKMFEYYHFIMTGEEAPGAKKPIPSHPSALGKNAHANGDKRVHGDGTKQARGERNKQTGHPLD